MAKEKEAEETATKAKKEQLKAELLEVTAQKEEKADKIEFDLEDDEVYQNLPNSIKASIEKYIEVVIKKRVDE